MGWKAQHKLEKSLKPHESIVWIDRPIQGVHFTNRDIYQIPLSIFIFAIYLSCLGIVKGIIPIPEDFIIPDITFYAMLVFVIIGISYTRAFNCLAFLLFIVLVLLAFANGDNIPFFWYLLQGYMVSLGLFHVVGRFFYEAFGRKRDLYALTSQRRLLINRGPFNSKNIIELGDIKDITTKELSSKRTDLIIKYKNIKISLPFRSDDERIEELKALVQKTPTSNQ